MPAINRGVAGFGRSHGVVKEAADIVVQAALIALQGEHVIAALFGDLRSDRPLAVQRVRRDDAAFPRQHLQKLRTAVISLDLSSTAIWPSRSR
jgi:hypothetical protein